MPPETRYAVYFDGLGEADTVFDFEETAIGHADENVNFEYVEYALVVAESLDGTRRVIYETGVPPEDIDVLAISVPIKPSIRGRLSPLAERVCV
jgi:hypothetical protein